MLRHAAAHKIGWLRRAQADTNARARGAVDRLAAVMCRASYAGDCADYRACCPAAAATVLAVQLLMLCIEVRLFVPHAMQAPCSWFGQRNHMVTAVCSDAAQLGCVGHPPVVQTLSAGLRAGVAGRRCAAPLGPGASRSRQHPHLAQVCQR
jgi:hypothetical protein